MPDPIVVAPPAANPTYAHERNLEAVIAKLGDKINLKEADLPGKPAAPAAPEPAAVEPPATEPAAVAAEPAAAEPADEPATAPDPVADPPAATPPTKLARSLEIQRRAAAATARAREQTAKRLGKVAPAAPPAPDLSSATNQALEAERAKIAQIEANYRSQLALLQRDPLEFARKHGVTGENLAQFVREGADPTARAMEQLRKDAIAEFDKMRKEHAQEISRLRGEFTAAQEESAQRNFFQFVEEAKAANPASFPALASGVIYDESTIWQVANRLLESRSDLRNDFDEDKLLEAVESEARKDPRWGKLQGLLKKSAPNSPQAAVQVKSNVKESKPPVRAEAAPRAANPPAPRDSNGQFAPRYVSPNERQALRVEQLIQRIGGRI